MMALYDFEMSSPGAGPSTLPAASPTGSLQIDLRARCRAMLEEIGSQMEDSAQNGTLGELSDLGTDLDYFQLLAELSRLVADPTKTRFVLLYFEPIYLDLFARWLDDPPTAPEDLQDKVCLLAEYLPLLPELSSLLLAFIEQSPSLHLLTDIASDLEDSRLQRLLLAYYRMLSSNVARLTPHLSTLYTLREHSDPGVRLLVIKILAKIKGWSEAKQIDAERRWVGNHDVLAPIAYGFGESRNISAWMLPLEEARRVDNWRESRSQIRFPSCDDYVPPSHLSPRVALVANTLFFRDSITATAFQHISCPSMDAALAAVVSPLRQHRPVLLTGLPSSGKSHLIRYLSSQLHPTRRNHIFTIPLADTSIDVKNLLGTYISSPTRPGTFEWMEGALTKAVRAGRWVVFDDIDRASMEMLVMIAGLARSKGVFTIPGRGSSVAGPGFTMFATRKAQAPPTFFCHHEFSEVIVDMPSADDILAMLLARFSRLPQDLVRLLVQVWSAISLPGQRKAREIGMRDLEKWCARIDRSISTGSDLDAVLTNQRLQDQLLLDAMDIFTAHSSTPQAPVLASISDAIHMDLERAQSLIASRRPVYEQSSDNLHIGRISMPCSVRIQTQTPQRPFALTKPSLILLEQLCAAIIGAEPLLLVGETGTGKTTAMQHLAQICGKSLTAFNLSTQTESSDLLGGFKPMDASVSARDLQSRWQQLFCDSFSMAKPQNGAYIEAASKALGGRKWVRLAELWRSSAVRAIEKLARDREPTGSPRKRRKLNARAVRSAELWKALLAEIETFHLHHVKSNSKLVFQFVEGPLVKAVQNGDWILLDEVNLASQETLEALSTLLESPTSSLVLTDRGDVEPITRHPNFRLFACMNPATDVGKKDLPPNLRHCFTEIYVPPPDDNREALVAIIEQYLGDSTASDKGIIHDVADLYTEFKGLSSGREIVDGSNIPPHYSMRTLSRALTFAVETSAMFGLRRALWEGWLMAFTMSLDMTSAEKVHPLCETYILRPMKNARAVLAQVPTVDAAHVRFGSFSLTRGPLALAEETRYVMTPSVQSKLSDLARVILTGRYPVLIQGPTSSGKTSAIEFLARSTGHRFVRINNHEHTDIQEYLGTYVTDLVSGNLVFQEGLLVTAVRHGHWIVLDELNLAPTDVLEALNRLLDDNRELVLPETQEVIRPHPNFMLFATQNPPGLYAGRKVLSRAFRNRFLEVHFDDVPKDELETILCQRCQIAPSYARKIVEVFEELRHRRQSTRVFESKQSFATLRDLFRWAERGAVGYQQLAEDGYMLLAERARVSEDKEVIKSVIEGVMKMSLDSSYGPGQLSRLPFDHYPESSMVWTRAMQRLFILVAAALSRNEPVLLVGETGCGKTSVCEAIAKAFAQRLVQVNCHQNMETADLIGSQRPIRDREGRRHRLISTLSKYTEVPLNATNDDLAVLVKTANLGTDTFQARDDLRSLTALFEWSDGPLVGTMTAGDLLLLDEVSLADDSVLERLNSVLEPGRTLVLAEKGGSDIEKATVTANPGFHVVATMNPGGDFGKKELSPALRNRFTEIWVPSLDDRDDLLQIIGQSWTDTTLHPCGPPILDFVAWFTARAGDSGIGLRDILAWVKFVDFMCHKGMSTSAAFHHGGQMVIVDGLESLPQLSGLGLASLSALRADCLAKLMELGSCLGSADIQMPASLVIGETTISVGDFIIARAHSVSATQFRFDTPTTILNTTRVFRACQLPKAILLEGSPGVGKTSLVSALAAVSGHTLQRINLSDQTDLIDLFGSDLPVDGGGPGEFQWRDAAFLDAMQKGDWVLLDEMNLASQTVLEGLNAVLDHRGTVFIPELGRSFIRHPDFRIFAAQNPHQQGGGRKGLPKSFLNRFTKVYLQEQTPEDLETICRSVSALTEDTTRKMITFNERIREATMITRTIGRDGSPWEFNLRDLLKWFDLLSKRNGLETSLDPEEFVNMIYVNRFRSSTDQAAVIEIYQEVFQRPLESIRPAPFLSPSHLQIGHSLLPRAEQPPMLPLVPLHQLRVAESILKAAELGWLVLLPGSSASGNRQLVQAIASATGHALSEFSMHPGVDASEILGSFQQQDFGRSISAVYDAVACVDSATEVLEDSKLSFSYQACRQGPSETTFAAFLVECRTILDRLESTTLVTLARSAVDSLAKSGFESRGFAWIDGDFITALRNGGWYLISEANLCNASVLDRLNSLCEKDGLLVLSEKGSAGGAPEVIKPNPSFRLFMTYDPKYGELSRAMRNRGVELYVAASEEVEAQEGIIEDSVLSTVHRFLPDSVNSSPSKLALGMAYQCLDGLSLLAQHGSSGLERQLVRWVVDCGLVVHIRSLQLGTNSKLDLPEAFCTYLPIDTSLNPNVHTDEPALLFRLLQLLARNDRLSEDIQQFVEDPTNRSTILAKSAASSGVVSRLKDIWTSVYPVIRSVNGILRDDIGWLISHFDSSVIGAVEAILSLAMLMQQESRSLHFNYSAISLLAGWLGDIMKPFEGLRALADLVQQLCTAMEITTGLGQTQIWSLFRQSVNANALMSMDRISDPALRSSVFQAVCLQPGNDLGTELQVLLDDDKLQHSGSVEPHELDQALLLPIEIHALARTSDAATASATDILVQNQHLPLHSLVPLKTASLSPQPGLLVDAISICLQRIVDTNASSEDPALFAPVRLASVLRLSSDTRTPLSDIPQFDAALKLTTRTVLWSTEQISTLRLDTLAIAQRMITNILAAFGVHSPSRLDVESLSPPYVKTAIISYLQQPLAAVLHTPDDLQTLGTVWIGISRFLLELYVTNIPIDPAVRRILQGEVYSARVALLQEELEAVEEVEVLLKGTPDSRHLRSVQRRLNSFREDQSKLGPTIDRPTDTGKLAIMHQEVAGFLGDTLAAEGIESLVTSLVHRDDSAFKREANFQLVSAAFIQRLRAKYSDVFDLVSPILTAILCAKFGMQCIRRHAELDRAGGGIVPALLAFPGAKRIESLSSVRDPMDAHTYMVKGSSMVQLVRSGSSRSSHLQALVSQLDIVYQMWSNIRLREQQKQEDAESLYRVRKTNVSALSDLEREEHEFSELFPSYEGVGEEGYQGADRAAPEEQGSFPPHLVLAFHNIVSASLGSSDEGRVFEKLRSGALSQGGMGQFSETLDQTSLAFQIHRLWIRQDATVQCGAFNFYSSPNEPEIRKAYNILSRLRTRLDALVVQWPEQMVLQHVRDRVERVLQLDVSSPVAQVLTALEGLMVHTDDWEPFANRENSLSTYRSEISSLIIAWRKLELGSWSRLLDDTLKQYTETDAEWTLRLFGALIHGSIRSEDLEKHSLELLPMLRSFLSSSTFGHYSSRIRTLRLFHTLSVDLASIEVGQGKIGLTKVSVLLHNVVSNASLYLDRIESSVASQRKEIDKAIRDFIKLASWKDVNVYALKASAQKSHRQLYKSVRKFREVLQQPVSPILADLNAICPQTSPSTAMAPLSSHVGVVQAPPDAAVLARAQAGVELPKHLLDLDATFSRYTSVLVKCTQTDNMADTVEQLATDIIETSLELAKATPSALTKDNKKIVQNLASRKRKAFADLLKSLRARGFSQNVRADIIARQQSSSWIASRAPLRMLMLIADSALHQWIDRVEHYHSRQEVLMTALRGSLAEHNEDIATGDLQRGIGFTESLYASALGQRDTLVESLASYDQIASMLSRATSLSHARSVGGGSDVTSLFVKSELHLQQLSQSMDEIMTGLDEYSALEASASPRAILDKILALKLEVDGLADGFEVINSAVRSSAIKVFSDDELQTLHSVAEVSSRIAGSLAAIALDSPKYRYLLDPVAGFALQLPATTNPSNTTKAISSDLWRESDELIQAMLVVVQRLPTPHVDGPSTSLPDHVARLQEVSVCLRLQDVLSRVRSFCDRIEHETDLGATIDVTNLLSRVLPFCLMLKETHLAIVKRQLQTLKASYKLTYVVGRIMLDLAQRGFCKPQEESKEDGEGGDETVEGTGMGAGTGDKNVSEEITEESQVEGLQGDEEENEKEEMGDGDDDDAVSMDDDFAGEMGEGKEQEQGDDEKEGEEDHDEMVGDVDPLDPGAVDEKFWDGGQEEKEGGKDDEVVEGKQQEAGESEMAAKEDKKAESKDQKPKDGAEQGEDQEEQLDDGDDNIDMEGDVGENEEQGEDAQAKDDKQDRVDLPEGDTLDLPEDLNLDDTQQDANDDNEMTLSGDEGLDEDAMDVDDDMDDDTKGNDESAEATDDGPDATGAPEDDAMGTEEEAGQQDLDLGGAGENDTMGQEADLGRAQGGLEEANEKAIDEKDSEDVGGNESQDMAAGKGANALQPQGTDQQDGSDGAIDSTGAPLPAAASQTQRDTRSLGDIMKDIRRRRDEILAEQERQSQPAPPTAAEEVPGQVEYVKEDEQAEDQALGPAGEEERQKLADLNILDEEQIDVQHLPGLEDESPPDADDKAPKEKTETAHFDTTSTERGPVEKALTQADVKAGMPSLDQPMDIDEYDEDGVELGDRKDAAEDEPEAHEGIVDLVHSSTTGDSSGEDSWRYYSGLTSDLSYALCEQLRLVLEPTLATRLQGDFRTGKRLNMRKIIPYIASEYTKDKIWLRRTKPSKREYQILLSLDDSRSMAESHSIDLAHQTLALVCQALNKLEVGQVAIAKFGQSVDILHPFGTDGFSNLDGAKVMQSFKFDQHRTDAAALVDQTLTYLAEARDQQASTSSGSADLWQLQIIISDGVCQDHDKLRVLLRRAIEERVMIVFIILDSLNQQSTSATGSSTPTSRPSILSMQSVEYKSVNGEMQLEMTRYLDTFPFEFFVVLRDVEALPGVLSDTLRQWMARVSQSQE